MKIAIISTAETAPLTDRARDFLPKFAEGLTEQGDEVHLITNHAADAAVPNEPAAAHPLLHQSPWQLGGAIEEDARDAANWLNELNPDVCLLWTADDGAWAALPRLNPQIATVAVGHADSEIYYAPARHYRSFLTRVVGTTPEVSVGFVLSCVIDKERVEWIAFDEGETSEAENDRELVETYRACFEKAVADARAAPRRAIPDFPPLETGAPPAQGSWLSRLKEKIMK